MLSAFAVAWPCVAALAARPGLYPLRAAVSTGTLAVDDTHTLYYEVHGKADGCPALFLHGGPGAGCSQRHAGFFDPDHYRIVLFDQRGCGRSTPKGSLLDNDTPHLVEDVEMLRRELSIDRWAVVLGGSWGVTLALAYAAAHPIRLEALVLRAVCLMRRSEIEWLFGEHGGCARLLPEGWHAFATAPKDYEKKRARGGAATAATTGAGGRAGVLGWYAAALAADDDRERVGAAASAWARWEMSVYGISSRLPPASLPASADAHSPGAEEASDAEAQRAWTWRPDERRWTLGADGAAIDAAAVRHCLCDGFYEEMASKVVGAKAARAADAAGGAGGARPESAAGVPQRWRRDPSRWKRQPRPSPSASSTPAPWVPAQARLTSHYSLNGAFFESDDALLSLVPRMRHIRCIAVQGGNDLICPPTTAFELHQAWPEMELRVVPGSGHSMYDSGLLAEVRAATDSLREGRGAYSETESTA